MLLYQYITALNVYAVYLKQFIMSILLQEIFVVIIAAMPLVEIYIAFKNFSTV